MHLQRYWDLGYPARPFLRSCDELCNTTYTLAAPFIGGLILFTDKRRFRDGWWSCIGTNGTHVNIYTITDDDGGHMSAKIHVGPDAPRLFDGEHPPLWTDAEVFTRATDYDLFTDNSDTSTPMSKEAAWATIGRDGTLNPSHD